MLTKFRSFLPRRRYWRGRRSGGSDTPGGEFLLLGLDQAIYLRRRHGTAHSGGCVSDRNRAQAHRARARTCGRGIAAGRNRCTMPRLAVPGPRPGTLRRRQPRSSASSKRGPIRTRPTWMESRRCTGRCERDAPKRCGLFSPTALTPRAKTRAARRPCCLPMHNTGRGGTGSPEAKEQQREIVRLLKESGEDLGRTASRRS